MLPLEWAKRDLLLRFRGRTPDFDCKPPEGYAVEDKALAYAVRFKKPVCVQYARGESPVCYIGSGGGNRFHQHKVAWLTKVAVIVEDFAGFELWVCRPRHKGPGGKTAYQHVEKDLVALFGGRFGERPLFNRMLGSTDCRFDYDDQVLKVFDKDAGRYSRKIKSPVAAGRFSALEVA